MRISQPSPGVQFNQALGVNAVYLPGTVEDALLTAGSGGGGTFTYTDGQLRRSFSANQTGRWRTAYEHERTNSASILWVGTFLTTPSQFACIGGLTYASTNISYYSAIELKRRFASGSNTIYLSHSAGAGERTLVSTGAITTGAVVIVGTVAPSAQSLFIRNVSTSAIETVRGTQAGEISSVSGARLEVGDTFNARNPQVACEMMVLFNRPLSDSEALMLLSNPYAVFSQHVVNDVYGQASAAAGRMGRVLGPNGVYGRIISG